MNLLGFDTSTAASAACVVRADGATFEVVPEPAALAGAPGHARELLPALARVIADAELGWGDLDAVAVGHGPGGFTGLRIGVATARGIAHSQRIPIHPVSSLAALAAGIAAPLRLALIDARRGELFAALYGRDGAIWEPFVVRPALLVERLRADPALSAGVLAAGDGSLRSRDWLEAAGVKVATAGSPLHVLRAVHVCRLARAVPPTAPEAVLPLYLRAPDARPQR